MVTDPLDTDLSSVDTSFPVLAPDIYDLRIHTTELMTNDAGTMKLEMHTTAPSKSQSGEPLGVGTKVFHTVNTKPTGKATPDMVARNLGALVQGVEKGWKVTAKQLIANPAVLAGKVIRARIGIQGAGTGKDGVYRNARNVVSEIVKK